MGEKSVVSINAYASVHTQVIEYLELGRHFHDAVV